MELVKKAYRWLKGVGAWLSADYLSNCTTCGRLCTVCLMLLPPPYATKPQRKADLMLANAVRRARLEYQGGWS